jgi:hypothetical protein
MTRPARREVSAQYYNIPVSPNQIEYSGMPVAPIPDSLRFPRPSVRGTRTPQIAQINVGTPRTDIQVIGKRETVVDQADSLEYARPIALSNLFPTIDNPELDEEFELANLGIDLQATEPLLPNVYYVGSDAPMLRHAQYPMPKGYPNTPDPDPLARITRFSDELLLFLFYAHARDVLQQRAAHELAKRRISYDEKEQKWVNGKNCVFDVDSWAFVPRS